MAVPPFAHFAVPVRSQSPLRQAITRACRSPEPDCVPALLDAAYLTDEQHAAMEATARRLVQALRGKYKGTGVEGLVQEYALSSQEGVALMCLAEALLRIPDADTRDALIRDKISEGDWKAHLGGKRSLFVNAATWGLVVTGKLTSTVNDRSLSAALTRLIARCGEPVIRHGVDLAMRMMGEQFVMGQTIEAALSRARKLEARGFRYSYDMLGEAAATAADAARYFADYERAIHAIGKAAAGRGVYEGPGISIKLSALHPRYCRAQAERVMAELLPHVRSLAQLAKSYDMGLNIDAEEADRLELSLDILEELSFDPALSGWNGLGFVVQAYGKRCPFVIDYLIDLAQRAGRRLMVRLVKGAYWDAEIKRAQLDGLPDFPVYTRKIYTDVSYIACARKLLAAPEVVFPQFATHNAQTLASLYHLAGPDFRPGQYEFQCLHGMGEPLYDEVVGQETLARPCRIYAPVGTHETLLAYLVRRLLENGANSSFVNRIADPAVPVDALIADPAKTVAAMAVIGEPHGKIALPRALYGAVRPNSEGLDLTSEATLAHLSENLVATAKTSWQATPLLAEGEATGPVQPVRNPGDHRDKVGGVMELDASEAPRAAQLAASYAPIWADTPPAERAAKLEAAAELMQARMEMLMGLAIREAGKTAANAVGEVREAIDFLRYYAAQARQTLTPAQTPLGLVLCISPWNFPLAIFTGQITAALAAGNVVLAKPAETTPLIAYEAVKILHEAGIPRGALQFTPGGAALGAALVDAPDVAGVMFTGSTEVARLIQAQLAKRLSPDGRPIPLIAETGGQNAMIVDSSALAEQVVADVLASAFDSAGQRCSALRVLCLQEDVAERTLTMLRGACRELRIGRTDRLSTDIGPVITAAAQAQITDHIETMRAKGCRIDQIPLPEECVHGTYVPPTIIEIASLSMLGREVFGPVLHVLRYKRDQIDALIAQINATGYGLTFGLHTRLDETITYVTNRVKAGNLYINRNIIGAVVGVQPFGGRGLSGTGPKAGGPLYVRRLTKNPPGLDGLIGTGETHILRDFTLWLEEQGERGAADFARTCGQRSLLGLRRELDGPVGERNIYEVHPRGRILLAPETKTGLYRQLAASLAAGNMAVIDDTPQWRTALSSLPASVSAAVVWSQDWAQSPPLAGALVEGGPTRVEALNQRLAALSGPLVPVQTGPDYCPNGLIEEVSISVNTTAAGGNASLMAIG
ncbi:trifunctional transcriptional regulator/proline dehydrogenase/L-glutamate gamma-semialdehyde dehydrogenase [Acidocella aminolytica]|uniref:trifunctional transcriptional regulator/proline dehydrogenase/L-glutamate gamma-semialdehyde dehydrogenase n=1 Tax=Acidocella aminolytica TaxID=33998 RepID=UPI0006625C02|nr:trifunctional transcriptional regulator/proline dehydrogenase/L-glutamate gamma-semialdehyde dehydrogenase [Acidocella aminolytica]SHE30600.1 L-proline dehydrogenase /delta-1-pyrroline-5-carboxylate dehydrogenase [Acidocella aminolytica 101 = DSM 11237]